MYRVAMLFLLGSARLAAQQPGDVRLSQPLRGMPVTRAGAIEAVLTRGPAGAIARADAATAAAGLATARQFENPTFGASYSESAPQAHFTLDIPVDPPGLRGARIAAARAGLDAAGLRQRYTLASLALDADTTYSRAQALDARARLSARTARDADSLLVLAQVRRDAGDASELDVELARVFAGQSANAAAAELESAGAVLLALQLMMGVRADSVQITLAEPLTATAADTTVVFDGMRAASLNGAGGAPGGSQADDGPFNSTVSDGMLPAAAAARDVAAAASLVQLERRRRLGSPSLTMGLETGNPGGPGGALPLFGVALPLSLFNRNGAAILGARSMEARALAVLAQARLEQEASVALARRDAAAARARVQRSVRLVASAERVVTLSLLAYREGAATLVSALDAQRTARETLAQFIDDLTAARIADRRVLFGVLHTSAGTP